MAEDFRDRPAEDDKPAFGWSGARRRLGGDPNPRLAPDSGDAPERLRSQEQTPLRPSGQLQRPAPQGRNWGDVESVPPTPPGIPGQQRLSALRAGMSPSPAQEQAPVAPSKQLRGEPLRPLART